jgi:hypothetical protein
LRRDNSSKEMAWRWRKLRWTPEPKRIFLCHTMMLWKLIHIPWKRCAITTKEYQPRKLETSR